jgi:hypothetical protein
MKVLTISARRNKLAVAAAALVLLTLVVGIIATSWQVHIARVERERAERRFGEVRSLAHSVLFDYHDAVAALPGSTALRVRLVNDSFRYRDMPWPPKPRHTVGPWHIAAVRPFRVGLNDSGAAALDSPAGLRLQHYNFTSDIQLHGPGRGREVRLRRARRR